MPKSQQLFFYEVSCFQPRFISSETRGVSGNSAGLLNHMKHVRIHAVHLRSTHTHTHTHTGFKSHAAHKVTQLVCMSGSNDITSHCFVFHSLGGAARTSTSCLFSKKKPPKKNAAGHVHVSTRRPSCSHTYFLIHPLSPFAVCDSATLLFPICSRPSFNTRSSPV